MSLREIRERYKRAVLRRLAVAKARQVREKRATYCRDRRTA